MGALLLLGSVCEAAAPVTITGVRMREAPERTRLVLDLDRPPAYRVFAITRPDRIVIDFDSAVLAGPLELPRTDLRTVQGLRYAARPNGEIRVVIDLREAVRLSHLTLPPNGPYGNRLVIDLAPAAAGPGAGDRARGGTRTPGEVVIVIDAGHGGEDPGAIGARGTLEKDVNLAIAAELARMINRTPGLRAVLTRGEDYYVGLRDRLDRARAEQADLFVSIHADAFQDDRVRGSSVYVLSQRGASSEAARWLAEQENASDRIGGVPLLGKDEMVKTALLEMSHAAQIRSSREAAQRVLDALGRIGKVHRKEVQHAGFLVLKSPDVPSILVETAFISNPAEEAKLRQRKHQKQVARAILRGVESWVANEYPGPVETRTLLAEQRHRVRHGETLSRIAARYDVTMDSIKFANNLPSDRIRAGEVLLIP